MNGDDIEEINGIGVDEDGDLMLRRKISKCKEIGDRSVLIIGICLKFKYKELKICYSVIV